MEAFLLLKLKFLGQESIRSQILASRIFARGSVGVVVNGATLTSIPWFLDKWILAVGEAAPYSAYWFKHYTVFWEPCTNLEKYCQLAGTVTESSIGHPTIISNQLLYAMEEHFKISEFHEHGSLAKLHLLWSDFLDQKQCCVEYHDGG